MSSKHYIRRQLLLLLTVACAVSALASGRFTARLVVDGAISLLFLPVFETAALAVVLRRARARRQFAALADRCFAGHTPWLLWLVVVAAFGCVLPSRVLMGWLGTLEGLAAVAIAWSALNDVRFFRDALGRTTGAAVGDVLLFRAFTWIPSLVYFFGIAVWPLALPWLGVAVDR